MKRALSILLILVIAITSTRAKGDKLSKKELRLQNTTTIAAELIGANNYPQTGIWILNGSNCNFDDLRGALDAVSSENRTIELTLEGVTMIPDGAFMDCQSLVTLNCPSASSVGRNAFANCHTLTTLELPVATYIGETAFSGCSSLSSLSLPSAITIKSAAFIFCESLTTLELGTDGAGVSDLGQDSFDGFSTDACNLSIKSGVVAQDPNDANVLIVQGAANYTFSLINLQ